MRFQLAAQLGVRVIAGRALGLHLTAVALRDGRRRGGLRAHRRGGRVKLRLARQPDGVEPVAVAQLRDALAARNGLRAHRRRRRSNLRRARRVDSTDRRERVAVHALVGLGLGGCHRARLRVRLRLRFDQRREALHLCSARLRAATVVRRLLLEK